MIIKHKDWRDICFKVHKIYKFDKKVKIKGEYWNLGFVESYLIGKDKLELSKEKFEQFETSYDDITDLKCWRYASWAPTTLHLYGDK